MAVVGKKRRLAAAATRGGEREWSADDGVMIGAGVSIGEGVVSREEGGSAAALRDAESALAVADLVVGDEGALDAMSATR